MNNYSAETNNTYTTTSGSITGGCCVYNLPPLLFVVIAAIFILYFGKTSNISPEKAPIQTQQEDKHQNEIASFFTPEIQYWEANIVAWAEEYSLDPNLIATVMQIESCGNPLAESPAGAIGLFQVMPYHFSETDYPFEPITNAKRGLGYLLKSYETHKSIRLALAGYNGGITTAGKPESQWPAETNRYVYWGENIYQETKAVLKESPTLDEWLAAGGASLCTQAKDILGLK
jgi:hypothetical protein